MQLSPNDGKRRKRNELENFIFVPCALKIVERNTRGGNDVGWYGMHGWIPLFSMDWRDGLAYRILRD